MTMAIRIREMIPVPLYLLAAAVLVAAGAVIGLFAFVAEGIRGMRETPRWGTPEAWGAMS